MKMNHTINYDSGFPMWPTKMMHLRVVRTSYILILLKHGMPMLCLLRNLSERTHSVSNSRENPALQYLLMQRVINRQKNHYTYISIQNKTSFGTSEFAVSILIDIAENYTLQSCQCCN